MSRGRSRDTARSGRRSACTCRAARGGPRGRGPIGMNAAARVTLVVALILGVGASPGLAAGFKVDPARSSLVLQLFKDGVAARLGHDHVVHASVFSGTVAYDPDHPDASSIQVAVEVGSLIADDPGTRRKFGLAGEPSASDRAES